MTNVVPPSVEALAPPALDPAAVEPDADDPPVCTALPKRMTVMDAGAKSNGVDDEAPQ
jgi:hypothetical protein